MTRNTISAEKSNKLKTFEDCYEIILDEVRKRRSKWTLSSISSISYEDIQQIILVHIWKKWHLYDQKLPLIPWLNCLISNQIKNLIRNNYSNFSRPCLRCHAAIDNTGCEIYVEQCAACPLYANWKRHKEQATHIKLPVSIENHQDEIKTIFDNCSTVFKDIEKAHIVMKQILKPLEFQVYEALFINNEDEAKVAKRLGYISNEAKRAPGYKQIKNLRKSILIKFKKALSNGDIDVF
jgi:hypothetical protein